MKSCLSLLGGTVKSTRSTASTMNIGITNFGMSIPSTIWLFFFWAFPTLSCGSGYILGAISFAYACRSPPRTKPRCAGLVPKGALSLTQMRQEPPFIHIYRDSSNFLKSRSPICRPLERRISTASRISSAERNPSL